VVVAAECRESAPNEKSSSDTTASDLLDAARRFDPQSWQEIVDRYSWLVFQWACQAGLGGEDAADIVQIVMADVAKSLGNFQKDAKKAAFRRWLRTITRRRIADFFRIEARQPHGEGGSSAQVRIQAVADNVEPSASADAAAESLRVQFWDLLQRLEDEIEETTWQAFWMTTVENRTSLEAAKLLDMTPNAVRLAKGRVFQRLRQEAANFQSAAPPQCQ
jgi:RNA polymerase sigma-70 factor (ECF subfamily)